MLLKVLCVQCASISKITLKGRRVLYNTESALSCEEK